MSWLHRILGKDGSTQVAADPTHSALRVSLRPLEVSTLGAFSKSMSSGVLTAGLAAGSNFYSFRNGGSNLALVREVTLTFSDVTTAFAVGSAIFNMFVARSFSASDTGGTAGVLTGNNSKLRSSFGTTTISDIRISNTGILTAGTRTLDTDPMASIVVGITATASAIFIPPGTVLWKPEPGQHPLVLAPNEGFVIQGTVPATGTWSFGVRTTWDETPTGTF